MKLGILPFLITYIDPNSQELEETISLVLKTSTISCLLIKGFLFSGLLCQRICTINDLSSFQNLLNLVCSQPTFSISLSEDGACLNAFQTYLEHLRKRKLELILNRK